MSVCGLFSVDDVRSGGGSARTSLGRRLSPESKGADEGTSGGSWVETTAATQIRFRPPYFSPGVLALKFQSQFGFQKIFRSSFNEKIIKRNIGRRDSAEGSRPPKFRMRDRWTETR